MQHTMTALRSGRFVYCAAGLLLLATGCALPNIKTLDAYRFAKKSGDYAKASTFLADDARIWFEKKEGPGNRLTAKGGPYKDWDKEFRSTSRRETVRARGNAVTYISYETNDYFRLIERQPSPARVTYYFDGEGRIEGMLYQGLSTKEARPPDRGDEFRRWADQKYPGLLDSPEMEIPNQPKRWRALLVEWRREVGLPAIE